MTEEKYIHHSKYFYGNKISNYGLEHKRVDYRTLAQAFEAVLNNEIYSKTAGLIGCWEPFSGDDHYYENESGDIIYEEEYSKLEAEEQEEYHDYYYDIYQWYIITERGAQILQELTHEIVYYNEELDIYLWGVTHWGTSWDYVLTDIPISLEEN